VSTQLEATLAAAKDDAHVKQTCALPERQCPAPGV